MKPNKTCLTIAPTLNFITIDKRSWRISHTFKSGNSMTQAHSITSAPTRSEKEKKNNAFRLQIFEL